MALIVNAVIVKESEKAYLFSALHKEGKKDIEVWIPKSQVSRIRKKDNVASEVEIPEWLAKKNELDYE